MADELITTEDAGAIFEWFIYAVLMSDFRRLQLYRLGVIVADMIAHVVTIDASVATLEDVTNACALKIARQSTS